MTDIVAMEAVFERFDPDGYSLFRHTVRPPTRHVFLGRCIWPDLPDTIQEYHGTAFKLTLLPVDLFLALDW